MKGNEIDAREGMKINEECNWLLIVQGVSEL